MSFFIRSEPKSQSLQYIASRTADFETLVDNQKTSLYFLKNKNGLEMAVTNFGARVVEFWIPDKYGKYADVVLGHNHILKYIMYRGERFLGATIGRFANRISKGQFFLHGKKYQLPINDGSNSLHGGQRGFDMIVWQANQVSKQEIVFQYVSEDGEEGFPGKVKVTMTYILSDDNEFIISHRATTDRPTVINLTHHSFFNLHGEGGGTINDHHLTINADHFTPVDCVLIPTGEIAEVDGTPMDFRAPKEIGGRLNGSFEQLKLASGFDHNWVINRSSEKSLEFAASVYERQSGRCLEVYSTQPGLQFYGGNFFDGKTIGKSGKPYKHRACFALETQHFPDSPNHPQFPSTVLLPDEEYAHTCFYRMTVK